MRRGRPRGRIQSADGFLPSWLFTISCRAMFTGTPRSKLATWPNRDTRRWRRMWLIVGKTLEHLYWRYGPANVCWASVAGISYGMLLACLCEQQSMWAERWAGVTEGGVSGERKFPPLPLRSRSAHMLSNNVQVSRFSSVQQDGHHHCLIQMHFSTYVYFILSSVFYVIVAVCQLLIKDFLIWSDLVLRMR